MSKSSDKSIFIHPFNFFIIQNITTITHYLNKDDPITAAYVLHDFMIWLDPEIKKVLDKEYKLLKRLVKGKQAISDGFVEELLDKVSVALHVAGYFSAAKWGITAKPTTMKDLRIRLEKAIYGAPKEE